MTESAALVLHIDDLAPGAGLVPREPHALRWLLFLVTAIYPTFTYGDSPAKWVSSVPDELRASTDAHRNTLWSAVEAAVRGPFFLGPAMSALDLYICVMTRWRPRRDWFAARCPSLRAIALAVHAHPRPPPGWAANY